MRTWTMTTTPPPRQQAPESVPEVLWRLRQLADSPPTPDAFSYEVRYVPPAHLSFISGDRGPVSGDRGPGAVSPQTQRYDLLADVRACLDLWDQTQQERRDLLREVADLRSENTRLRHDLQTQYRLLEDIDCVVVLGSLFAARASEPQDAPDASAAGPGDGA